VGSRRVRQIPVPARLKQEAEEGVRRYTEIQKWLKQISSLNLDLITAHLIFAAAPASSGLEWRQLIEGGVHVKQFLGFEDPQNRVSQATQRTAPLIFYIYDLVLLWHAQSGISSRRNPLLSGPGTTARRRFPSKIFFEIYGKPLGRKRFSATPDWMYTPYVPFMKSLDSFLRTKFSGGASLSFVRVRLS
jgi:hypothetical protein